MHSSKCIFQSVFSKALSLKWQHVPQTRLWRTKLGRRTVDPNLHFIFSQNLHLPTFRTCLGSVPHFKRAKYYKWEMFWIIFCIMFDICLIFRFLFDICLVSCLLFVGPLLSEIAHSPIWIKQMRNVWVPLFTKSGDKEETKNDKLNLRSINSPPTE